VFGIENPMPAGMGIDRPIPLTILVVIASLGPKGIPIAMLYLLTNFCI
jgi:hypothetical protein